MYLQDVEFRSRLRSLIDSAEEKTQRHYRDILRPQYIARADKLRDLLGYAPELRHWLQHARQQDVAAVQDAIRAMSNDYSDLIEVPASATIDVLLSYRAFQAWGEMIEFVDRWMPGNLKSLPAVQLQYAMALNRNNQGDRAEQLLGDLIAQFGSHPEPWGLLGRVYKDRWEAAQECNIPDRAEAMLAEAILVYLEGYDADPREAYPAINAATLMTVARLYDSPQYQELLSLLERTIDYRAQMLVQDYFDYATRAEFAVLKDNERAAHEHVTQALDVVRESWEPLTTARNIRLIREAKERYGQPVSWIMSLEERLGEIRPSGHVGLSVAGA